MTKNPPEKMQKGQKTRLAITQAALRLAAQLGLDGLTIGNVAQEMDMSKSGVFAHFGSREELLIAVVQAYHQRFYENVFAPALQAERGLPRLLRLFDLWLRHLNSELDAGTLFLSSAMEFDDKPGSVRDAVALSLDTWLTALTKAVVLAKEVGHLYATTDPAQVAFEWHGLMLAWQIEARLLQRQYASQRTRAGFESLLARNTQEGYGLKHSLA